MPPTVKSLEERIDDLADDIGGLKTQMAVVTAKLDLLASGLTATQTQLATLTNALSQTNHNLGILTVRLDTVIADVAKTNLRIDATNDRIDATNDRIDKFLQEFADFRGRAETMFGLLRWIGAIATAMLISVVAAGYVITLAAGKIEARIDHQDKAIEEIRAKLK